MNSSTVKPNLDPGVAAPASAGALQFLTELSLDGFERGGAVSFSVCFQEIEMQ
jgi:hypothetical protein